MKKFLIKIIIFLTPIIITTYLVDYFFSKSLKDSRLGEFSTSEDIYNGEINSDIVIYGSSRALIQIDPNIIEKHFHLPTYNLGMDGQNIWLQYLRHLEFLKYNKKPKVVIYSLDDFLFKEHHGVYNKDQFLPYILWQHPEIKKQLAIYNVQPFSELDYKIPFIRYIGTNYLKKALNLDINSILKVLNNFQKKPNDTIKSSAQSNNNINVYISNKRIKGYSPQYKTWNGDFNNVSSSLKYYNVNIEPKGILLFEKIIKDLQKQNIQVILVFSPEYIEGQKFIKNRNEVMNIYTQISKKFNIPFYDYSDNYISYDKKYFYNALHLNAEGSKLFTNELVKDLEPKLKNLSIK